MRPTLARIRPEEQGKNEEFEKTRPQNGMRGAFIALFDLGSGRAFFRNVTGRQTLFFPRRVRPDVLVYMINFPLSRPPTVVYAICHTGRMLLKKSFEKKSDTRGPGFLKRVSVGTPNS